MAKQPPQVTSATANIWHVLEHISNNTRIPNTTTVAMMVMMFGVWMVVVMMPNDGLVGGCI